MRVEYLNLKKFLELFTGEENDTLREIITTLKSREKEFRENISKLKVILKMAQDSTELMPQSPEMLKLMELAKTIAGTDSTVLIRGEIGTGKERMARFVHDRSTRADGPFITVNCGAISETLLESELFGHAHGAFTGATSDRPGLFEAANGGTLFLDEVGEITLPMQVKLLRALQEREIRRVGANKNLKIEVTEKRFHEDFYYCLKVVELAIPPLRQRKEDILPLARLFLAEAAVQMRKFVDGLTASAEEHLLGYSWPGNVRELADTLERSVALAKTNRVDVGDFPPAVRLTP